MINKALAYVKVSTRKSFVIFFDSMSFISSLWQERWDEEVGNKYARHHAPN